MRPHPVEENKPRKTRNTRKERKREGSFFDLGFAYFVYFAVKNFLSLYSFNRTSLVKKLEHISLVRLVPGNLHRGNRADVQAFDMRKLRYLLDEIFIFCNRAHRE